MKHTTFPRMQYVDYKNLSLRINRILVYCIFIPYICIMLSACSSTVPQQRVREAKLMPKSVAARLVDKYIHPGFSKSPTLPPSLLGPLCTDRSLKYVKFEEIIVGWVDWQTTIRLYVPGHASFWCGSSLNQFIYLPNNETRDDLIDALHELGANVPRFNNNSP